MRSNEQIAKAQQAHRRAEERLCKAAFEWVAAEQVYCEVNYTKRLRAKLRRAALAYARACVAVKP